MKAERVWRKRSSDEEKVHNLARTRSMSQVIAHMLVARGISTSADVEQFLQPSLKGLIDPSLFQDMDKAVTRIITAIDDGQKIGIFGDYDVDGVSSAAILAQFFTAINTPVCYTLPHRMTEGYGLSKPGIDRLRAQGAQLMISVDCGITAHQAVDYANSVGLDVIVVDHHAVGEVLPHAFAVINPKRSDCGAKADYLCAAGVAFFLCMAVRRSLRARGYFVQIPEPDLKDVLDLVALATVCDVVPLIKDNRILVKAGLRMLKTGARVGLSALMDACGVDPNKITSTNLGFHLGPRINAAGRLEDATKALSLLLSSDAEHARKLACMLNDTNLERRALEEKTVEEACGLIENDPQLKAAKALVLHQEAWHPGVVGIVASRIAERYHRPAIIIGEKGKGSGRSIKGIDLHGVVSKAQSSLLGFGGHAHAIGVTLGEAGVAPFLADVLRVIGEDIPQHVFTPEMLYDAEVSMRDLDFALVDELAKLEPFGAANPYPVVRLNHSFMRNLRRLEGGHIKGELEGTCGSISFIGFRMDVTDEMASSPLDVLGVVEKNEWQGRVSLQLRVLDYKKSPTRGS